MRADLPARGELWWADLDDAGRRPVLVLSRDAAILGRRRSMVAACSTTVRGLPSEVTLVPPVPTGCVVQPDAVVDVDLGALTHRLGRIGVGRTREACAALPVATGCG